MNECESVEIGAICSTCGFQYQALDGHIIPCPVCALKEQDKLVRDYRPRLLEMGPEYEFFRSRIAELEEQVKKEKAGRMKA